MSGADQMMLDSVPKLGWGKNRECTFLGALEAALAVTDHPCTYSDLMGWSGMAFRVRWFAGNENSRWCGSSAVAEMEEEIAATANATGWPLRVEFLDAGNSEALERYAANVVASINSGRPVLAYEPKLNMDVVFGYEEGGKLLLLRDYFQPDEPVRLAPSGLGFLSFFIGEHGEGLSPHEGLLEALRIAVRNWHRERFSEGPGEYWYGKAALTRWINDLGEASGFTPEEQGNLCFVSRWSFSSMHDARKAAVTFLREHAPLLKDTAAQAVLRAAEIYEREVELLDSASASKDAFVSSDVGQWSPEMRQREIEILTRAKEIEEEAIAEIERALKS